MKRYILLASCAFIAGCAAPRTQMPLVSAQPAGNATAATTSLRKPGENSDLELGGFGVGAGHFVRLRDMTFGADGRLYTLETAGHEQGKDGDVMGLGRVQIFDGQGHFQSAFSLGADAQGQNAINEKNEDGLMAATRLAVDSANRVYVSFPSAGIVRVFDPKGAKIADIALPNAKALAKTRDGKIVAVASQQLVENGHWTWKGGDTLFFLGAKGIEKSVPLAQTLWNVADMDTAPNGDVVILGAKALEKYDWNPTQMIWRFGANGQVLSSVGSGNLARAEDGSEPLHSLVVSKNGDISAMTYGNPGKTIRYSGDGKTITSNYGWFKWADSWSIQSGYTILALAPDGRLWVGVTQVNDPKDPNYPKQNDRPVVLRANADFFSPTAKGAVVSDARALGFAPHLESPLPYNIAYKAGEPIQADVIVAPAKRQLSKIVVSFKVYDPSGTVVAKGQKPMELHDGQEARLPLEWTPPRFGAYSLVASYQVEDTTLSSQAIHFGVTPRFPNMPALADKQSGGGWEDAPRQAFTGLRLMRLHPDKGDDKLDADLKAARDAGDTVFVQLTDKKDSLTPERARQVMGRVKGRVRYVELYNEPDGSLSPEDYVKRAQPVYDAIKAVDPSVSVLGPAVCGMKPGWYEAFYHAGGKTTCDILSAHDYEGHESISPEHWVWKVGELRRIMAKYGDEKKPIWQTERAISSVRGGLLMGMGQAIRLTLHRDLLSSLGIPDDHNSHFYLNEGGFSGCTSYVWCGQGPLPSAIALRCRAAMIDKRAFAGSLDFGPTGNTLFMGERYRDASGDTLSLRNLIGAPMKVQFVCPKPVQVFDAWGNALHPAVQKGVLTLSLGQLPTYVRMMGGANLRPIPWDWGEDVALGATVSAEGKTENNLQNLSNGKLETIHADNPLGGTDGKAIVFLKEFSPNKPATVSLDMGAPTTPFPPCSISMCKRGKTARGKPFLPPK